MHPNEIRFLFMGSTRPLPTRDFDAAIAQAIKLGQSYIDTVQEQVQRQLDAMSKPC